MKKAKKTTKKSMKKQMAAVAGVDKFIFAGLLLAGFSALFGMGYGAFAWGPASRTTYSWNSPAPKATFNSIKDNPAVGDERNFVRIAEKGSGTAYADRINIEANKEYDVYIYYHNDAASDYNDEKFGYKGVATDVRLTSAFPLSLKKGEQGKVSGKIMFKQYNTTEEQSVWDEAYVTAKEDLTLRYVAASAKIYNRYTQLNGKVLGTQLFEAAGTKLGVTDLDGIVLGCAEYSGHVIYTIRTFGVETGDPTTPPEDPVDPILPTDTPENPVTPITPDTPDELPKTGVTEVALGISIILIVIAGVAYYAKTKKEIKKVTKKGKKSRK